MTKIILIKMTMTLIMIMMTKMMTTMMTIIMMKMMTMTTILFQTLLLLWPRPAGFLPQSLGRQSSLSSSIS